MQLSRKKPWGGKYRNGWSEGNFGFRVRVRVTGHCTLCTAVCISRRRSFFVLCEFPISYKAPTVSCFAAVRRASKFCVVWNDPPFMVVGASSRGRVEVRAVVTARPSPHQRPGPAFSHTRQLARQTDSQASLPFLTRHPSRGRVAAKTRSPFSQSLSHRRKVPVLLVPDAGRPHRVRDQAFGRAVHEPPL